MAALVNVEDVEGVRVLTLCRPEKLNALSHDMMLELVQCVEDAVACLEVGCIVLTGAGRAFCAGGDLRDGGSHGHIQPASQALGTRTEQSIDRLRHFARIPFLLHEAPKVTIAMINGPVAGAGIGLAGACDLRFAAESAVFVPGFDRIGAGGDFGSTWFWSKILGTGKAREMFLLGEKIDAKMALEKGIYTRLYDGNELLRETMTIAKKIAAGPLTGFRYMKRNLNNAEDWAFEAALDSETTNMSLSSFAAASISKVTA